MATHGADSEVGRLRTVMLHRPGNELKRLTPRNNDRLLFDGIPWVARAQEEHDAFADALRSRGVEVLYLTELLTETLAAEAARRPGGHHRAGGLHLGDTLRDYLSRVPRARPRPRSSPTTSPPGIRNDEVRGGFGLVTSLLASDDFLIDPLPNLLFTRDSSVWVRDRVAVTSLAMPARARETQLTELIYTEHPRFRGTRTLHGWHHEHVEGGDVLLLAPGVIAVGVGERTTPAGVERFARQVFHAELAHTVLAVPIAQERATMHLDTVCTMVDVDAIVMYPNVADSLQAYAVTPAAGGGVATSRRCRWPTPSRSWWRPRRRWRSTRCARSTPASTRSPPSASSGTTATTPSRSRPASPSPTSATTRPTRGSRRPASRSSGSPAPSSAPAAAARGACPARCLVGPCRSTEAAICRHRSAEEPGRCRRGMRQRPGSATLRRAGRPGTNSDEPGERRDSRQVSARLARCGGQRMVT